MSGTALAGQATSSLGSNRPPDWRHATWGQIARLAYGKALRERSGEGPVTVYGTNGQTGRSNRQLGPGPTVVIGRKGAYRGVHYAGGPFWVIDTAFFLVPSSDLNMKWAYYELLTHDINRLDSGSAIPSTRREDFYAMPVRMPRPDEQHRIATVLTSLDDRIDSNRRLAAVLEEVVATEFRARFVDFVYDDAVDRTRSPDGWATGVLGAVGRTHRESAKGAYAAPYIGLDLMPRGSTVLTEWLTDNAPTGQAATFERGDILFGKLRPYFRKVGVAPIAGRCSTEILVLRPTRPEYYGLLLGHVASDRFIEHCDAVSRGTRMPRAEWRDASTFDIAIPPAEVAAEFSQFVRTLYSHIIALTHQSRTLASLRDALLPKLISGEIRVPDTADPGEVIGPAAEDAAAAA